MRRGNRQQFSEAASPNQAGGSASSTVFRTSDELDAAVQRWLRDTIQPGDMVLVGGSTVVSRFIQRRLNSDYTHAALVTGEGTIVESYDYRLSMGENDDGVTETNLADFHARHAKIGVLSVYRPEGLDVNAVLEQIQRHSQRHIPYPTAGMVVLALAVTTTRIADRQRRGSLRERLLRRLVVSQINMAADGDKQMHCAEYVTRMYWSAGLALHFRQLTLAHSNDGGLVIHDRPVATRPAKEVDVEQTRRRRPQRSTATMSIVARSAPLAAFDLCRSLAKRRGDRTPVDLADVVFPPDLAAAAPMVQVGRIQVDHRELTIRSLNRALP